ASQLGPSAVPTLRDIAQSDKDPTLRLQARQAVERLTGQPLAPSTGAGGGGASAGAGAGAAEEPVGALPPGLEKLVDKYKSGKGCKKRREALRAIRKLADPRALPAVKKYRKKYYRKFIFLENANSCLDKEAGETVELLEGLAGGKATTAEPTPHK